MKSEVLKELPPKSRRLIEFECPDSKLLSDERAAFSSKLDRIKQCEDALARASQLKNDDAYKAALTQLEDAWTVGFSEMAAFRRRTGEAKLPFALEYIQMAIEESEKVIVFAHHRSILEAIHKHFPGSVLLYGGMNPTDKQRAVDRFQNDPACPLFVGSITAAGEGITLTASSHYIAVEMDWRPSMMEQCESRPHRMGQTEAVLCDYLVLKDSCDARFARRLVEKMDISEAVLDDQIK